MTKLDQAALLRRQFDSPGVRPVEPTDKLAQGAVKIAEQGGDVEAWLREQLAPQPPKPS